MVKISTALPSNVVAPASAVAVWLALTLTTQTAASSQDFSSIKPTGDRGCSTVFIGGDVFLTAGHCPTARLCEADCPCHRHRCERRFCTVNNRGEMRRVGPCSNRWGVDDVDLAVCRLCDGTVAGPYETLGGGSTVAEGDSLTLVSLVGGNAGEPRTPFPSTVSATLKEGCFFTDSSTRVGLACPMQDGDSGSAAFSCLAPNCDRRVLVGIHAGKGSEGETALCKGANEVRRHCREVSINPAIVDWIKAWAAEEGVGPICGIDPTIDPAQCRGGPDG